MARSYLEMLRVMIPKPSASWYTEHAPSVVLEITQAVLSHPVISISSDSVEARVSGYVMKTAEHFGDALLEAAQIGVRNVEKHLLPRLVQEFDLAVGMLLTLTWFVVDTTLVGPHLR